MLDLRKKEGYEVFIEMSNEYKNLILHTNNAEDLQGRFKFMKRFFLMLYSSATSLNGFLLIHKGIDI